MALTTAARLLSDYVAIPSVNPMGRGDPDPAVHGEARYAEHLEAELRALGLDCALLGAGDRRSVVAELRVAGAQECVLVASHLDTVPVEGMTIAPFDPVVEVDRLYGRGSCDTKAGMAALVAALRQLLSSGPGGATRAGTRLRRSLIVVGEADEELASSGVADVLAYLEGGAGGLPRRAVAWALATEPTGLRLVTHHKGRVSARLRARGRACHASDPDQGDNAIVALSRMVLELDALHRAKAGAPDRRLGPGTLSVGLIGGGLASNVVPDEAWAVVDWRMLPGETPESVGQELQVAAQRAGLADAIEVAECRLEKDALATEPDAVPVLACGAAMTKLGLTSEPLAVGFGTDAGPLSRAGIPSVVMGPGHIAQAHTADEWVSLSQLEAMQAFFVELLGS